jgi:hypothetical protein
MSSYLSGITRPATVNKPITNPPIEKGKSDTPGANLNIQGRLRLEVIGPDETGEIVTKQTTPWIDNILTTYGLASLASAVGSSAAVTASNWIEAMYIGTSTTAPTSTDTSLGASTASLTVGSASLTKTNTGAQTVEWQATFASNNAAGAYVIGEVGLYCNSTGNETQNKMAAHATLSTQVSKGASDVTQISYDITFTTA